MIALAASHGVRSLREESEVLDDGLRVVEVSVANAGDARSRRVASPGLEGNVQLAFAEWGERETAESVVLLVHGSPGSHRDFDRLAPKLAEDHYLVAPDLPGFGGSSRNVPDFSVASHALYSLELLDRLGVERFHVVGFSMGGGVALEIGSLAPDRVASATLISSIGVQEMELLGSYSLNHMIHGLQLAGIWLLEEAVPHFGMFDGGMLTRAYARNFYDTDQRPLRGILERWSAPLLIVHGIDDFLVPPQAAREHARLVPHSELEMLDSSHFFLFSGEEPLPGLLRSFLARVDAGRAATLADASPQAVARAREPLRPDHAPPWMGPALLVVVLLLALATFVSEDLTCIGAGLLVAQGRLSMFAAIVACFLGIFLGDLLLYAAGRFIGRPIVRMAPMRWLLTPEALSRSEAWFEQRGAWAIGLGRFVPGTRLPTYVAAGVLKASFLKCTLYFLVAAAVWTPLLVGLAFYTGLQAIERLDDLQQRGLVLMVVLVAVLWVVRGLLIPMLTWRGRRRWVGRWRRWTRWEFWPPWLSYPPVVAFCLYQGLKHRSLLAFTATNPFIPAGGVIGESKAEIFERLDVLGDAVPRWKRVPPGPLARRVEIVAQFRSQLAERATVPEEAAAEAASLGIPLVLKPEVGQRGAGVAIVRTDEEARRHLEQHPAAFIVQEFVDGAEYGVFWVREAGKRGRILSITEKTRPTVTGDGRRTVEDLVLSDPRAVALAEVYREELGDSWLRVPTRGELVELAEIGAHSRGTLFLRGSQHVTEELEVLLRGWGDAVEGFDFGRYDVRVPSIDALENAHGVRILELNGVTSESTDVYDPQNGLGWIYRRLFEQWRLAYAIGAENQRSGVRVLGLGELVALLWKHRRALP